MILDNASRRLGTIRSLPPPTRRLATVLGALALSMSLASLLIACAPADPSGSADGTGASSGGGRCGPLHTVGAHLVNAAGTRVDLSGVNWFGFETQSFTPHGLDVRNYQDMLNQIAHLGFNTVRLPYSNQLFDPASLPTGINYTLNPDLRGLHGVGLMDKIVAGATKSGLCVILDQHRQIGRAHV